MPAKATSALAAHDFQQAHVSNRFTAGHAGVSCAKISLPAHPRPWVMPGGGGCGGHKSRRLNAKHGRKSVNVDIAAFIVPPDPAWFEGPCHSKPRRSTEHWNSMRHGMAHWPIAFTKRCFAMATVPVAERVQAENRQSRGAEMRRSWHCARLS